MPPKVREMDAVKLNKDSGGEETDNSDDAWNLVRCVV